MEPMSECQECGLKFYVVWANDGEGAPTDYCPRCGSGDVLPPDEEEAAA